MGKKRDKKKAAEVEESRDDDISDIVAAIDLQSVGSKHKKKKKKPVADEWDDDDDIEKGFEMLSLSKTPKARFMLPEDEEEDEEEEDEDSPPMSTNRKGRNKPQMLDWGAGVSDDEEATEPSSNEDSEEDAPEVEIKITQNKTSKKKKKVVDDESDDMEQAELPQAEESEIVSSSRQTKKEKKSKKKRGLDDDWEADIEKELEMIASGQEPPEEKKQEKQKGKGKKDRRKKNDDWEDEDNDKETEGGTALPDESTKTIDESEAPQAKTKQGKKSKKKREVDDWEADIEKELEMIASGQEPPEEKTEKPEKPKGKGKKDRKQTHDKMDDDQIEAPTSSSDIQHKKEEKDSRSKKGKKGKKSKDDEWVEDIMAKFEKDEPEESEEKKEKGKKSRKKKGHHEAKEQSVSPEPVADSVSEPVSISPSEPVAETIEKTIESSDKIAVEESGVKPAGEETTSKKKKKKKKDPEEEKAKKKPSKAIKMMQEALRKRKEEEEKFVREEEERIRKEEEAYQKKLAEIEEEKRRKEKKKQDKKARIQKQKEEGTYLTPTQREAKRRREAYLKVLIEQGIQLPTRSQDSKMPKYDKRKKQEPKKPKVDPKPKIEKEKPVKTPEPIVIKIKTPEPKVVEEESEDDWETMADKEEKKKTKAPVKKESSISEETSSSEESEDEESLEELTAREKAEIRMKKLRATNEAKRTTDDLRSPVICVMGHVDTGKTKILDKIRHTHVQDGEAGGITQQIGATNIPVQAIKEQTKMVENFSKIRVPGLLVIDTPGHESFSNLRSRGSSNCDMAILVVDIMHGLEPQTIESINMLRKKKTPFVVALNKVDRLYQWKPSPNTDVVTTVKQQTAFTTQEFQKRVNEIIVEFAQQELNVKLFNENDDPDTWISMVPTSAHSGDGMGNLMAYVVEHCQSRLAKRLAFSENLQCTVLEVKAIQGLGTTVDVILTNGRLKYGDTIVLPGTEGPIVTHIKALLMPQPLKELRVKNPYDHFKEVRAAQGVKVLAKELDKALAGTSLLVARRDDEIDILKEDVQAEVDRALKGIKLQDRGVFVQASTLGSLEALLEFLKQSKIPYAGINIGPVHKRDVMKASVMLEHDDQWAVILAFDVKVEREAQELADSLDVKIFTADIIYHLFDAFIKHREDLKRQKQDEFRHVAVFPCKLKIVPNCVFKSRDPIVIGVSIEAGQLRVGTPVCVPGKDFLNVGIVASIEMNHKSVEVARKPQEVCIKIDGTPGEAPKMVGRHFDETDILTSKISRDSIDLLKNWFRDDMQKGDWQLIIELKKLFEIM